MEIHRIIIACLLISCMIYIFVNLSPILWLNHKNGNKSSKYFQSTEIKSSISSYTLDSIVLNQSFQYHDLLVYSQMEDYTNGSRIIEFSNLKTTAIKNYPKFINCLKNSIHTANLSDKSLIFPEDAESHYKQLLALTESYHSGLPHHHAAYGGPWIEQYFARNFLYKPLSHFGGLIPLFIYWTDIHVSDTRNQDRLKSDYISMFDKLIIMLVENLRDDVIYVTVVQDDEGISMRLTLLKPNILVLSAGGFGHIPIPLIKGELRYISPPTFFEYDVSFFGEQRGIRRQMIRVLNETFKVGNLSFLVDYSSKWLKYVHTTKFNLAPRGFGRSSFRLTEIIQLGRIPIYIYDDIPWLPYGKSPQSVYSIGVVVHVNDLSKLGHDIQTKYLKQIDKMLDKVKTAREEYTYRGVIRQIDKFFLDPFGSKGGQLTCTHVPNTVV